MLWEKLGSHHALRSRNYAFHNFFYTTKCLQENALACVKLLLLYNRLTWIAPSDISGQSPPPWTYKSSRCCWNLLGFVVTKAGPTSGKLTKSVINWCYVIHLYIWYERSLGNLPRQTRVACGTWQSVSYSTNIIKKYERNTCENPNRIRKIYLSWRQCYVSRTGRRPAVFNSSTVLFVLSYFPVLEFRSVQFDSKVTKTRNQWVNNLNLALQTKTCLGIKCKNI